MITSHKSQQVKYVINLNKQAKFRNAEGCYVVEGPKMFGELPKAEVTAVYVSERYAILQGWSEGRLASETGVKRTELVKDEVFEHMSDTKTPQGILAVVRQKRYSLDDLMTGYRRFRASDEKKNPGRAGKAPLIMILENIQDPGNLGTILRAGEGAGVTGVLMSQGTVDIYNSKVIRSTMGSSFRIPFMYTDDLQGTVRSLKEKGITVYAAHLGGMDSYERMDYTKPTAFMIGNESSGLTEEMSREADCLIRIPMEGRVESLNAAVASAILGYEAARQRRNYCPLV